MTNLLPPTAKKQIVVEYWTRVICAWVLLWSVCLFIGVVLLWPTYVLLTGNNEAFAESASAATERTNEYQELSNVLTRASMHAEEIVTIGTRPLLSDVVRDVLTVVDTSKVEITGIQIAREEAQLLPFTVSGEAVDRLALAQLRDSIESLPFVGGVDLPIENLAKNEDISFSLRVTVLNEKL